MRTRTSRLSGLLRFLGIVLRPRHPVFLWTVFLAMVGGVAYLFATGDAQRAVAAGDRATEAIVADAGLTIAAIHLEGNRNVDPHEVYGQLGFMAGDPITAADPQEARARLKQLPWIRDVEISRRYPDAIAVTLIERVPFALWRSNRGLYAVERDGHPIAAVQQANFRHLPFFFGDQPDGAFDLVSALYTHRAVAARVKAMQRVSGRRWNLLLDDGVLVKLPEENWAKELSALERLIVEKGVLERDITEIDLRSHDNYIFGLRHQAPRTSSRGEPT